MFKFKNKSKGFTLIELLVVIAIIGILASVVLASLNSARRKSRDARRLADVKQIQVALELYFDATSNEYPDEPLAGKLNPTYIAVVPTDPNGGAYSYSNITNADAACAVATGVCTSYVLRAVLEDDNPALDNDIDGTIDLIDCGANPEVTPNWNYCVKP